MRLNRIIKLFEEGNVCVCGLKGRGKDMLMANVTQRRKLPYVSNVDYGGDHHVFVPMQYDCGRNTYEEFIAGDLYPYVYPYPDGTDIYISDAGVYFPSQFQGDLVKKYGFFCSFMALSRHLGECNVHFNVQNLNRCWDKIREQSDIYIMCNGCRVIFGKFVVQRVTLYESYDSAVRRVPPFRLKKPWFNADRRFQWDTQRQNYAISYGRIESGLLIYRNKSNYNTRVFKEMLANGTKVYDENETKKCR